MASMSPGGMSISSYGSSMLGPKEQRAREKRRREELRNKLEGLPAPQNEYGLVAPEVGDFTITLVPEVVTLVVCVHGVDFTWEDSFFVTRV